MTGKKKFKDYFDRMRENLETLDDQIENARAMRKLGRMVVSIATSSSLLFLGFQVVLPLFRGILRVSIQIQLVVADDLVGDWRTYRDGIARWSHKRVELYQVLEKVVEDRHGTQQLARYGSHEFSIPIEDVQLAQSKHSP